MVHLPGMMGKEPDAGVCDKYYPKGSSFAKERLVAANAKSEGKK